MAINLSNLNISLDKFNAVSGGEYNIGQMKLSSDGKSVYRTNNHKTWTIFNWTKISSEEALAVKLAFCKALSNEGLSKEAVDAVKAKLGISGGAVDALKAGKIKPLTAAEVREVVDQYAGEINQKRASAANGAKALKTSRELYSGVGLEEMAARATERNAINARSIEKAMSGADKAVNSLMDVLQFGESGESVTSDNKKLAREIMIKLGNPAAFNGKDGATKVVGMTSAPVKFSLQDDGKVLANITLGNGNSFSIDTGLDRAGLADKAAMVLNAAAAKQYKAAEPHAGKKSGDGIMDAINELEQGGIEPEENEADKAEAMEVKPQAIKRKMSNENLLKGLDAVFQALKDARGQDEIRGLREANMESVVRELQLALDEARHLDDKNTKIINSVREAFYGNKDIDTDHLLKSITDIITKKAVNPEDKVEESLLNNIQDDLDENLNINDWLGIGDGKEGEAQVEGFGQNAKKVRDAHARMAKKVNEETGTTTTERRNANMLGIVNRSICDECKKMAAGDWENVTFFNDVARKLNVMLPSGERLSNEFEEARNQLASLVKKDATYSDLSDKEKAKVHVLMAILNQRAGQGLLFSEGLTLDPKGNTSPLFFDGQKGAGSVNYSYSLSLKKDGALNIECNASQEGFDIIMLFGGDKNGMGPVTVMPGKGSKIEASMSLRLDKAEFDRLAEMDFSKYDAEGVEAKFNDKDVQNRYGDRTLLGEEFMFDDSKITCTSTYKLTLN